MNATLSINTGEVYVYVDLGSDDLTDLGQDATMYEGHGWTLSDDLRRLAKSDPQIAS